MKRTNRIVLITVAAMLAVPALLLAAKVGAPAPDFTATGSDGKTYHLGDYRGKFVVLEWHNNGCPYTRKHYDSGNMQRLQKEWTGKGVVWFTVISSAPGTQGYMTAEQENEYKEKMQAVPTAVLLDSTGEVGHLYEAKTTPQLVVIDPQGKVIYDGAIDDHPTTESGDIPQSKNYLDLALKQATAGKQVEIATSRPYGCSVKYAGSSH